MSLFTGETQAITNPVNQKCARIDGIFVDGTVNGDTNLMFAHLIPLQWRGQALSSTHEHTVSAP